jgi:hypothetical protein
MNLGKWQNLKKYIQLVKLEKNNMANPNARDNLIPAKKGEVRNPKGRGHSLGVATVIRRFFDSKTDFKDIDNIPKKMSIEDAIVLAQIKKAMEEGDTKAFEALLDRLYGKPKQPIEQQNINLNFEDLTAEERQAKIKEYEDRIKPR